MFNIRQLPFVLFGVALLFSACGYQFARQTTLPNGIKNVTVVLFRNDSAESGLEYKITNAIIDEIKSNSAIEYLDDTHKGPIVMGNINSLTAKTFTRKDTTVSSQKQLIVSINVYIQDQKGKKIWTAEGITEAQIYEVISSDISKNSRNEAIELLVKRIAEKTLNRMTQNF